MKRFFRHLISRQEGQVLPIVLGVLAIGGLTIAMSLNYATTNLKGTRILRENIDGIYAASAGVEHALWSLGQGLPTANSTPADINGMPVSINTVATGNYTLYFGELIEPDGHNDYLDVDGVIAWDADAGAYKYTITVTWQALSGESPIKLTEIGARLPAGYGYQAGSAANFAENLSTDEPDEIIEEGGAYLVNWVFGPPLPDISEIDPVATQSFYISGSGDLENYYAWVVASRTDIGAVGEIAGELSRITARAISPEDGRTTATVVANVIIGNGTTFIVSWQISD